MQTIQSHAVAFSVPDIITMTARLAQVLASEVDLLQGMKMKEVAELQEEKRTLTSALEQQKSIVRISPEVMGSVSDDEKLELSQVVELFNTVLKENHRQLVIAREVNQRVVNAITDAVNEKSGNPVYTAYGTQQAPRNAGISVTLNETI